MGSGLFENRGDCARNRIPAFSFLFELTAAFTREAVVLGLAVVFGDVPFGLDPAFEFHSMQRRIQRTFLHAEDFLRDLLNSPRNGESVIGPGREDAKDQEGKCALKKLTGAGLRHGGEGIGWSML